jgi:cobalt-precorrin 5A hydrolase / precorrin-3B C17-methyltransferase
MYRKKYSQIIVLFQEFKPIGAIATTPTAIKRLQPLIEATGATLWIPESLAGSQSADIQPNIRVYTGSLKIHLATIWHQYQSWIFALAAGAVVRLIAPLLEDKSRDPAVVVIDEMGEFAISLCSGHQGGADRLARAIALQIGATPVISGASAGLGLPAVDMLGIPFGWQRGEGNWTAVAAAISRNEPVEVIQEVGSSLWQKHLPPQHPFQLETELNSQSAKARIWISFTHRKFSPEGIPKVQWHPRVLWVGIGCERGTSKELIATAIEQVFQANHLAIGAIAGIATIDLKADEVGLVELCQTKNWPLKTYPAEILRSIPVPTPSEIVASVVGTPSVAEAAAIVAVKAQDSCSTNLLIRKQIFRANSPENPIQNPKSKIQNPQGAVTVAVALSPEEYTGRPGSLYLIGIGPGQLNQMTPAAQSAINQADAVIGYSLYIDLIAPLLRPGQIVESLPITQEVQRAMRAIALAKWGLTVAVVSSGDCGIYGMAGLVLEQLQAQGWDGNIPQVQVFPGITALQAAASRVGAPLMHDFCAISLSDLLTPWEVIEKRLKAAAEADFVTALYNPRSQTRTQQISIAKSIFLQYRDPNTPIAIARSVYRQDEQITITTLAQLLETSIDMLSTVLIGNSNTRNFAQWMITPRGYNLRYE